MMPGGPARVGLLVERRYLSQAQPAGMEAALRARGHGVKVIDPESAVYDTGDDGWLAGLDLLVCRGRSWGVLCLLSWAEARGVRTINSRKAVAAVHNKAEMAVALAAGRVPTPATFLGPVPELLKQVHRKHYPLILKPLFGDNSLGLRVVHAPEELACVEWPEPVALAQHFVPTDGYDLKLYVIGDQVRAVRKRSPLTTGDAPPAQPAVLDARMADLARGCGRLFGLELFGLDCVETPDGPLVIEVNEFPNYTLVADADTKLADYVLERARQAKDKE